MDKNIVIKQTVLIFILIGSQIMSAQNNTLNIEQRSIVIISALTATGDIENLKNELNSGLNAGLTVNQIKEVLVHLYAYCGFPRSLNGINTFMAVLKDRRSKDIIDTETQEPTISKVADTYEQGRKVLEELTKTPQQKPAPGFGEFAPRIDTFLKEHLFADVFSSPVLTYQQRELVTISALAAMPGVAAQLTAHLAMGKNTGLTDGQLQQVAILIGKHVGKNQEEIALKAMGKTKPEAEATQRLIRIAKIEIDPAFLVQYRAAIEEQTKAAIALEPGVLALYATYDKEHPTKVTVFEVYASNEAYQFHLKTPHFLKYKNDTLKMVKSLELVAVDPIAFSAKPDFLENGN